MRGRFEKLERQNKLKFYPGFLTGAKRKCRTRINHLPLPCWTALPTSHLPVPCADVRVKSGKMAPAWAKLFSVLFSAGGLVTIFKTCGAKRTSSPRTGAPAILACLAATAAFPGPRRGHRDRSAYGIGTQGCGHLVAQGAMQGFQRRARPAPRNPMSNP